MDTPASTSAKEPSFIGSFLKTVVLRSLIWALVGFAFSFLIFLLVSIGVGQIKGGGRGDFITGIALVLFIFLDILSGTLLAAWHGFYRGIFYLGQKYEAKFGVTDFLVIGFVDRLRNANHPLLSSDPLVYFKKFPLQDLGYIALPDNAQKEGGFRGRVARSLVLFFKKRLKKVLNEAASIRSSEIFAEGRVDFDRLSVFIKARLKDKVNQGGKSHLKKHLILCFFLYIGITFVVPLLVVGLIFLVLYIMVYSMEHRVKP